MALKAATLRCSETALAGVSAWLSSIDRKAAPRATASRVVFCTMCILLFLAWSRWEPERYAGGARGV